MSKIKGAAPTEKERVDITSWLKKGAHIDSVLAHVGVPKALFNSWLKRGAAGEEPYKTFGEAIDDALVSFELGLLNFIAENATRSASAAQWLFMVKYGPKYRAIAEAEAKKWQAENGHLEHTAGNKPISADEIEAIERRALSLEDRGPEPIPAKYDPTSLEAAKKGTFGLQ